MVHPLDPLTADEIEQAVAIVRNTRSLADDVFFVRVFLHEPPKEIVLGFREGEPIDRQAFIVLRDRRARATFEVVVSLARGIVVAWRDVAGVQPPMRADVDPHQRGRQRLRAPRRGSRRRGRRRQDVCAATSRRHRQTMQRSPPGNVAIQNGCHSGSHVHDLAFPLLVPGMRSRLAIVVVGVSASLASIAAGPVGVASAEPPCFRLADHSRVLRAKPGHVRRENIVAHRQQLSWLLDSARVRRFLKARLLVLVPPKTRIYEVSGVAPALRVTRPWTKRFIEDVSGAFFDRFGTRLKITSLTRTAAAQRALRRVNANAAPADGQFRSAHLTGAAVDISKRPLGDSGVRWIRVVLQHLAGQRLVSAIEEFRQPHFHVLVFRDYEREARRPLMDSRSRACAAR